MDSETGPRLKEIRKKLGLSQRQLAKASDVANATISQIESGNRYMPYKCIRPLNEAHLRIYFPSWQEKGLCYFQEQDYRNIRVVLTTQQVLPL